MWQFKLFPLAVCIAICGLWASPLCYSQQSDDHGGHAHDIRGWELGLSAGFVHFKEEDENVAGIHGHVLHRLGEEGLLSRMALGVGGEVLGADEKHYAAMVPFAIYPWHGLMLSVAPGIQWAEHEGSMEEHYVTHVEAAYAFEIGQYDIGPVIGYSKTKEESHYMMGFHFGIHL